MLDFSLGLLRSCRRLPLSVLLGVQISHPTMGLEWDWTAKIQRIFILAHLLQPLGRWYKRCRPVVWVNLWWSPFPCYYRCLKLLINSLASRLGNSSSNSLHVLDCRSTELYMLCAPAFLCWCTWSGQWMKFTLIIFGIFLSAKDLNVS